MFDDKYNRDLGALISSLLALEFVVRVFLCDVNKEPWQVSFVEGNFAPENRVTNYDSLGSLIKQYNALIGQDEAADRIDLSFIKVRDCIAHGRVVIHGPEGSSPIRLYKFGRKQSEGVPVETVIELSPEWFLTTWGHIQVEIHKVGQRSLRLKLRSFTESDTPS